MIKEISIEDIADRFGIELTDNDYWSASMNKDKSKLIIEVNEE